MHFMLCYVIGVQAIYYAALLRRRGPHIASHSVCPSVPFAEVVLLFMFTFFTVEPSYERTSKIEKLLFSLMGQRNYFSAHTEGRISYGHLAGTNLFYMCVNNISI